MCGLRGVSLAHWVGLKVDSRVQVDSICNTHSNSDVQNVDYGVVPGGTLGSLVFL